MTPEEYAIIHPKAFRCAFDFLNEHFPPEDDPAWWDKMAKDCSAASLAFGENELVIQLLCAVSNYIGKEYHKRRDKGGETDN